MEKIVNWLNEITKPKAGILHDMGNGLYEYEIDDKWVSQENTPKQKTQRKS